MFVLKAPSPTFLGTLQTIARVATENWKLQVKWNNSKQSFTDCRTEIQIGWSTDWIMEGCSNLAEWTAAMKGLLEHEIAHILFSRNYEVRNSEIVPLFVVESYFEKLRKDGMPKDIAKFIEDALEDGRVNRLHVNMSPKMIQTVRWIVRLIYKDACRALVGVENPLAWALNSLLGRILIGKDLEGVPEETVRFLDSVQKYIEEGLHAESTSEMITKAALPIAEAFIDEFPSMFVPAHLIPKLEYGKHRPVEDSEKSKSVPDREIDVRVSPKKPPKHESKTDEDTPEKIEEGAGSSEEKNEEVSKSTEETTDSVLSSDDLMLDEEKPEFEEKPESERSDLSKETAENEVVSKGSKEKAGADEFYQPESDDFPEEVSDSGEVDEPFEEERGSVLEEANAELEGESSKLSEEGVPWVDGIPEVPDESIDLESSSDYSSSPSEDDGLTEAESSKTSDNFYLDASPIVDEPTEDEAEEALAKISKWAEGEEIEEETDFTELLSKSAEEASEYSAKDEALEREICAERDEISKFEAGDIRKFSVGLHTKVLFKEVQAPERAEWVECYNRERDGVSALIDESSDAIREYLAHQKRSTQRNLRSGRIDPHRLWRASGLLDCRIFMERETPNNKTDVVIYLLLDMSGSMGRGKRIEKARKAAIILVEILEMFGIYHTVVGFTADINSGESVEHYRLVNWGEAEKHRLMFYHNADNNRDGYSLRIASEELSKRPEKAKIILMLSDGEPCAENYGVGSGFNRRDRILNDVASAVEEAEKKKIEVLHLYFGDVNKETLEKVAYMYPKLSVITDPVDVPGAVADIVVSTLRKYM